MSKKSDKKRRNFNRNHRQPFELRKEVCSSCSYRCRTFNEDNSNCTYSPRETRKIPQALRYNTAILHHYCRFYNAPRKLKEELDMIAGA